MFVSDQTWPYFISFYLNVSFSGACIAVSLIKVNSVPRMTQVDHLKSKEPIKETHISCPKELSKEVEMALVKCLQMCTEF
jgi:hypothetical protein